MTAREETTCPTAADANGVRLRGPVAPTWIGRNVQYVFLAYLLMYPLPWFARTPEALDVIGAAVGIAVFVPLYLYAYRQGGWRLAACSATILVLGFAMQSFGGIWGVFAVYAMALAAYLTPRRHAVAMLVAIATAVCLYAWLRGLGGWDWIPTVFFGVLVGVASMYTAAMEQANVALAASREEARRLAAIAERERIARDLHDVLGHTLTLVAVKADLAGRLVAKDPEAARAEIEDIRSTARAALTDLRAAVTGMRSVTLAQELVGARSALASAGVEAEVQAEGPALPPAVETALAYVLREAVTNVVRHAGATQCRIALERDAREARLEVRDDGRGSGTRAGGLARVEGNGIAGMRERLAALGGDLQVESRDGTRVLARVPLAPEPVAVGTDAPFAAERAT